MDLDANHFTKPTNMDQSKKYHVWGGSLKTPHLKVVVNYVISLLRFVKKKKKYIENLKGKSTQKESKKKREWESLLGWKPERAA